MKRFVILEHDHPVLHWDLMLEAGDVLRTWRLAQPPAIGVAIEATPLGDHRRMYLEYEGPVSGGRGAVKRWDWGEFAEIGDRLMFYGQRVKGNAILQKRDETRWFFVWLSEDDSK